MEPLGKLGTFQIKTTEPERIWYLKAETDLEMQNWIDAILLHSKAKEIYSENSEGSSPLFKLEVL